MLVLAPRLFILALALAAARGPAHAQTVSGQNLGGGVPSYQPSLRRNNILIVMADDMSVDTLSIYGLDPSVPSNLTPNIDQLATKGVLFLNAYTNPLCSSTRASLLTGEYPHHTGIGSVIESAQYSLPQTHVTLPEALRGWAPQPYETASFGKWHLEYKLSPEACPALLHGFDFFDGSLTQVGNALGNTYCSWGESVCPSPGGPVINNNYMLSEVFDEAIGWIATRNDSWFCYFAPESPYQYPHVPPMALQQVVSGATCANCDQFDRNCWNAHVQAFDTKLGELIASLGPSWWNHTTIVFTADNGTPNNVNTYWPNGAKGRLWDGGVHVPMIIAGRAVAPGRRGSSEDGLVQLTDIYRTVASLAGVPSVSSGFARDSVDLGPLLQDPPGGPLRQYAYAEKFKPNQPFGPYLQHEITVRDTRFKLIWDETNQLAEGLYDLSIDPLELNDLLLPTIPLPGTPEGDAYVDLLAQIQAQLSS